jgi:uncharacterized protein (DUF433 family)
MGVGDPRAVPRYGASEAAHYLALPKSTVRAWTLGQAGRMNRVIRPATRAPLMLSFWNLVEVYVLASMRRRHGLKMRKVRGALAYVSRELGKERPLIEQAFLTDGVDLFIERYAELVNTSKPQQRILKSMLEGSLQRIARDDRGVALKLYPWLNEPDEPKYLELDVRRAGGRLVIARTGIPTDIVAGRFRAGESVADLAGDYNLDRSQVEAALRWEQSARAA